MCYLDIKLQWERWLKIICSTLISQFRHVTRLGIFDRHNHGIPELAGTGQLQSFEPTGSEQVPVPAHVGLYTAQDQACQGTPEFQTRLSLSSEHSYNLNCTGFFFPVLHSCQHVYIKLFSKYTEKILSTHTVAWSHYQSNPEKFLHVPHSVCTASKF